MSDSNGADRPSYGVGPAYPTAHPQFVDGRYASRVTAQAGTDDVPSHTGPLPTADPSAQPGTPTGVQPAEPVPEVPVEDVTRHTGSWFAQAAQFPVSEGVRDVGMVFMGASMTAGYGDPKGLGWVGRVVARTQHPDLDLTAYNLGVRGNSSSDVVARWAAECHPRWEGRAERRLVLSVGANDLLSGMTMARSRLNLANVIDEATNAGTAVFVVGLTPSLDGELNRRIEALAEAQADVCSRRGITYVDCFRPLVTHDQWMADLAASPDRAHPGQAGYGLIAWLVLHNGWNDWLQIG